MPYPVMKALRTDDLVLVQGLRDTRATLSSWRAAPARVLGPWLLGSASVAAALLASVWLVATLTTPDAAGGLVLPGLGSEPASEQVRFYLSRNGLVLALHALACVAGFIAGSSLPAEAERYSGWWRAVHDHAGRLAMGFVAAATLFSLSTQAWILGDSVANLAAQNNVTPALMLALLLPHAIPELVALFLPLAAWLVASRQERWSELLAATGVTVMIAVPVLVAAALIEAYVTPELLRLVLDTV